MKYYTFDKWTKRVAARQRAVTLEGEKSEQWIFVNTYGSQPIMPDILPFFMDYDNGDDLFFVSEKVKNVLDRFVLPHTSFTACPFYWEDKIRKRYNISEPTIYYKLNIDKEACQQLWDFEQSRFIFLNNETAWNYSVESIKDIRSFSIGSYEKYYQMRIDPILTDEHKYVTAKTIVYKGKYDAMYILGEFVFNEFVYQALKNEGANLIIAHTNGNHNLTFDNISLPEAEVEEHIAICKQLVIDLTPSEAPKPNHWDEIIKKEIDKRDRLLFTKDLVKEYYKTHTTNKSPDIIKKEMELDVLFPEGFEEILNLTKTIEMPEGFFMLGLNEIISVGTGKDFWQDFTPRAIKAVGIANDGCGDYIGYILEEDSDIQLSSELIIFNHEIGSIEELE